MFALTVCASGCVGFLVYFPPKPLETEVDVISP